ncbi:hypothetical protein [Streptomyces erythrochromogenes]|uniref:hypothetical protein n=1 Tax=Streptomyces erythrochromogenes TaxID=285574 RepID=UPI0038652ACA|nr:hypothetical protein OG364_38255 [Streptomyces erythrochromogenes]
MDAGAVAAALEEARFDARQASRYEDLADDLRGPAELAEWERIAQLLAAAGPGAVYDPDADDVVQAELAADAAAAAVRVFEACWGLTPISPLDPTARRWPVTGEAEKAARRGLAETARESLQRTVRTAAALAHDDTDFLDRLRDAGLRVRERLGDDGTLVGYAVALPGDRADRGSRPVWFSGSTLAYDLSLPRVRERSEPAVTPADCALAEHRIQEASALLGRAGQADGAGDVAALGDLLAVAAEHAPALVRDRVRAAADSFEQAARAPGARSLEGRVRAGWRSAARALEHAPPAGRGGGAAVVLTLLIVLVEAVEAATAWHRAQPLRGRRRCRL